MRDRLAVLPKVICPYSGHRYESPASWLMVMLDEASFVGFFPYRKARARRPPDLDYLGVRPRVWTDPFKQVEDQNVYSVRHGSLLSVGPDGSTYPA